MSDQNAATEGQLKNSRVGVASLAISVTAVALTGWAISIWFSSMMFPEVASYASAFGLVAFALGIASLFLKEEKKYFAILGLVFSVAVIAITKYMLSLWYFDS